MLADEDLGKNILLIKGAPMSMSGYNVTYTGDTIIDNNRTFSLDFSRLDEKGKEKEKFTLKPNVVYERDFSKVAASNPSTLRGLVKDIYVHIASLPPEEINQEQAKAKEDSLKFETYWVNAEDTVFTKRAYIKAGQLNFNPQHKDYKPEPGDIALGVNLEVGNMKDDTIYHASPMVVLRNEVLMNFGAQINDLSIKIELHPDVFKPLFERDAEATRKIVLKQGEKFSINGREFTFEKFKMGDKKEEKLAVFGELMDAEGKLAGEPKFEIIGNSSRSDKVFLPTANALIAMTKIDPQEETATFEYNSFKGLGQKIPLRVSENSTRSDYIVLEAVKFPGINFFWLGSLMMMAGLGWSILPKLRKKGGNA